MQKKVAAKPLQSCSTLCDPIDAAHQAPPIPGILQARVLEWGARKIPNATVQPSPWATATEASTP